MSLSASPRPSSFENGARQLLIVDDEPDLLHSLISLFERHYLVIFAESGEKALELLQQGYTPQVILSDNRMPGISGIELLAESAKYVPDAVRVIMTGFTDIRDILAAINHGHVYMYLTKPWQIADLLQAVRICFQHHQVHTFNKRLLNEMDQKHELLQRVNEELFKSNKKLGEVNHQVYGDLLSTASMLGSLLGSQQRYYYSNHAGHDSNLVRRLGEHLEIKDDRLNLLEIASLLRDIGKIGLPNKIQGATVESLNEADQAIYESHVSRGAQMLRRIDRFKKVADIIEQHHERIDGSGFPNRLKGPQLSQEAQIVGLVDLYHETVYRIDPPIYFKLVAEERLELDSAELRKRQKNAVESLRKIKNKFDPEILEAFLILMTSDQAQR